MVSTKTEEITLPANAITDGRRALVGRVIGSSVFAKSERLSTFLSLVCELTLNGRANEINEQKIGTMLFGRSSDYDSSIDGIVRTQASRLRQRLDLYFSGEGANEPIRIILPRGTYVPLFEPQSPVQAAFDPLTGPYPARIPVTSPTLSFSETPHGIETKSWTSRRLPWALVAVLSIVILALVLRLRSPLSREASLPVPEHPLWNILFRPDQRTMIVPGDSGLVMWQGLTNKTQNLSVADYLSGSYRVETPDKQTAAQKSVIDLANRRYTSIVDLDIVTAFSHIAEARRSTFELRYARDVRPNDMKAGNVVLIQWLIHGLSCLNPT